MNICDVCVEYSRSKVTLFPFQIKVEQNHLLRVMFPRIATKVEGVKTTMQTIL